MIHDDEVSSLRAKFEWMRKDRDRYRARVAELERELDAERASRRSQVLAERALARVHPEPPERGY